MSTAHMDLRVSVNVLEIDTVRLRSNDTITFRGPDRFWLKFDGPKSPFQPPYAESLLAAEKRSNEWRMDCQVRDHTEELNNIPDHKKHYQFDVKLEGMAHSADPEIIIEL